MAAVTRSGYIRLEEKLRGIGFRHDTREDAPMCRWLLEEITVDVIPTGEPALGWKSRWLAEALDKVTPRRTVMVITAPYFLAAKMEAWKNRGDDDFLGSVDLEAIVTVVDGRPGIADKVNATPSRLQRYLRREFRALLNGLRFAENLSGHLPGDAASQLRVPTVLARFRALAGFRL